MEWFCRWIFFGHRWRYYSDGFKRECQRCHRDEMLCRRFLDSAYAPSLIWRDMTFRKLKLK